MAERVLGLADTEELRQLCNPLLASREVGGRLRPGLRRVLEREPRLIAVLTRTAVPRLMAALAGPGGVVVRSILFDKSPESNWLVPWHQDAAVAVRTRVEVAGFGPWSIKDGEPHCRPPRAVLDRIIVLRLHLDDCGPQNGPLRVVPRSHEDGLLDDAGIQACVGRGPVVECCTPAGGVVLMRPHTVHSSPKSVSPTRRRVLHLEFTGAVLPEGLEWAEGVRVSCEATKDE